MKFADAHALSRAIDLDRLTPERIAAAATLIVAVLAVALGCLSLGTNSADALPIPVLGIMTLGLAVLVELARRRTGAVDRTLLALALAAAASAVTLAMLPEYTYGHEINGIIHRSLFSGILLLIVGTPVLAQAMYYFLGATPTAHDVSRYPLIVMPVALAFFAYGVIFVRLLDNGIGELDLEVITQPFKSENTGTAVSSQPGMLNHIIGTFLLIGMTWAIAIPIGVGTGYYLASYDGLIARVIEFCTTLLRAISVFIIGAAAYSMVEIARDKPPGSVLSDLVRGYYHDANGFTHAAEGSFLLAAIFLSLLVIPVIARATEEGFRSVPSEIKEGSVALGATEGHGLMRILLPWAMPNIITGAVIAAAEAAGTVAVILLIAGDGQHGVGPLHGATSLAYFIFDADYGQKPFVDNNGQYQYAAALLLVAITLSLSVVAIILKARFGARYRGGLTG